VSDLDALEELATRLRPWPGARAVVLREAPPSVFVGVVGMYGGISHAPSVIAFIGAGDTRGEAVGYTGEALVLEATALGLDTCWVGGLFSGHAIGALTPLGSDERVHAVAALGYAHDGPTAKERLLFGAGHAKRRRSADEIAPGHDGWPTWAQAAVAAARVAPSAMNRQPWRFGMDGGALTLAFSGTDTPRSSKHLDCGIAMLHAEVGALGEGVRGTWELVGPPGAARFVPAGG